MSAAAFNPNAALANANVLAHAKGLNVTVNLNAAPLANAKGLALAHAVPMSSPIADFSFLTDAFDLAGAAAADPLAVDLSTSNALNALRRSAAAASAVSVLPSPSPPLNMALPLGLAMGFDASLALPAAHGAASLMADDAPNAAAAAAAALHAAQTHVQVPAAAPAHPFALSYSAPGSPSLSLAGDATDPDSPSSIASDLSSASSLLTSAAGSPRILASLPRHSSTPSLAALAAAAPAFAGAGASPAQARAAPALPSLKPSLRQSNSKNNLVYLSAAPKGVTMNSFSLAAAVNSASASAAATEDDEQPSKKKQKANDSSMRRVKSSPALADDSDASDSDSDDDMPPAKGAAAAKGKGRRNPISLLKADGKPKSEAEIKREKAERRLAKKAEAARQSRKRKKAYVQQLEEKAAKLEARLAQLEGAAAANAAGSHAPVSSFHRSPAPAAAAAAAAQSLAPTPSAAAAAMVQATTLHALHREEQTEVLSRLSKAVTQFVALATTQPPAVNPSAPGAAQAAAQAASAAVKEKERLLDDIKALIERYVVNSRKRQQTVTYYLDRLAELMVPEAAVKVALWGLSQPDAYYAVADANNAKPSAAAAAVAAAAQNNAQINAGINAGAGGAPGSSAVNQAGAGVFSALMAADVGVTTGQLQKLAADFRAPVSGVMDALKKSAAHVAELREHVKAHMVARNRHIDELRHILNPIQIANYLLWIERNPQLANRLSASSSAGAGKNQNNGNNSGAGSASAGSGQTGAAKAADANANAAAGGAGADGAGALSNAPNSPVVVTATAVPYAGVMGLSGLGGFAAYGGAHGK